jgi:hypothetical protein
MNEMTNAEHLIENAITCMTNGKEYEFFARQSINREMAGNLDWYLEEIWQMADYVVNVMCQNCKKRVHWIPVEDELPKEIINNCSERVLVTDGLFVNVEWYDYKLRSWDCEGYSYTDEKFWGFFPELPEVNE